MTINQINKKAMKIQDDMQNLKELIENKLADLEDEQLAIEDNANYNDRDMTEKEQERYDKLEAKKDYLNSIEDLMDYDIEDEIQKEEDL